jgi:hypothetical protein
MATVVVEVVTCDKCKSSVDNDQALVLVLGVGRLVYVLDLCEPCHSKAVRAVTAWTSLGLKQKAGASPPQPARKARAAAPVQPELPAAEFSG